MSQTDSESSMFSAMASILQFVGVSDLERRRHSRQIAKIHYQKRIFNQRKGGKENV